MVVFQHSLVSPLLSRQFPSFPSYPRPKHSAKTRPATVRLPPCHLLLPARVVSVSSSIAGLSFFSLFSLIPLLNSSGADFPFQSSSSRDAFLNIIDCHHRLVLTHSGPFPPTTNHLNSGLFHGTPLVMYRPGLGLRTRLGPGLRGLRLGKSQARALSPNIRLEPRPEGLSRGLRTEGKNITKVPNSVYL